MVRYGFLDKGKYIILKKDELELLEHFVEKGMYIAKTHPNNDADYHKARLESSNVLYETLYNKDKVGLDLNDSE